MKNFEISIIENFGKEEFEVSFEDEVIGFSTDLSEVRAIIEEEAEDRGLSEEDYNINYNY